MTAPTVTQGDRYLLEALAHNCATNKRDAYRQAAELVPLVAAVPDALDLFDVLVDAVARGDVLDIGNLLNQLTAGAA